MKNLKIILRVYSARLGKDFSLPLVNQLFQLIGSLCFFYLHLYAFQLIINNFNFPGWSKPELMVLLFTFEIFTYLGFFLFWNGLNKTVRDINTGAFDLILSKPASSRLITFFRGGGQHNAICAGMGAIYLTAQIITDHLPVSFLSIIVFILSLLISFWIVYCLSVFFVSLNFRYGNIPATIGVMFQIQEIYKYPSTIFPNLFLIIFSLFTTLPAAMLLLKPLSSSLIIIYVITAVISTILAHISWSSGLRHYSSTGS
jgi:ABC-type uncharacterized transport system permease subunit